MFSFILITALITLLTLIILVRPLLKTQGTISYERDAQNIHFAKDRLQELDLQLKNESISTDDYEALKSEIESTLALDIDLTEEPQSPSLINNKSDNNSLGNGNGLVVALLCFLVPIGGLALYKITGTPASLSAQSSGITAQTDARDKAADIETMLRSLETKLQENPNDIEGWAMLARSYQALGRYQNSLDANIKLLELGGDNPDVYAAMADSSALLANGILAGQPHEYVQKALSLQEKHPQALWLAGVYEAQSGNNDLAREYWKKLLPLLAGAPLQQQELQTIIDQSVGFTGPATNKVPLANASNGSQDIEKVTSQTSLGPSISIRVRIDEILASQTQANDIVFIFARAKQGPPAPLAVRKIKVSDLPANITLTDSDAMMDQFKLSRFDEVLVSARVARSGNPIAQPGDFQSELVETKTNTSESINLNISQQIK